MIIDVIVFVLLVMALIKGLRRGLIIALFSIIAFIIGIAAALKLSVAVAGYLEDSVNVSAQWLPVLSFLVVFIVVVLLIRLGAKLLEKVVEMALLGWVNKLGGFLLYALFYLIGFSVLLFFAVKIELIKNTTLDNSVTYAWIRPIGPFFINSLGSLIPFFKDMFAKLEQFFDHLALQTTH